MDEYLDKHIDHLFPAELAYNLNVMYGTSFTSGGVRQHMRARRAAHNR